MEKKRTLYLHCSIRLALQSMMKQNWNTGSHETPECCIHEASGALNHNLFQINGIKFKLYSLDGLHLSPTEKIVLQLFQLLKPYFSIYLEACTVLDNFIIP